MRGSKFIPKPTAKRLNNENKYFSSFQWIYLNNSILSEEIRRFFQSFVEKNNLFKICLYLRIDLKNWTLIRVQVNEKFLFPALHAGLFKFDPFRVGIANEFPKKYHHKNFEYIPKGWNYKTDGIKFKYIPKGLNLNSPA